MDGVFEGRSDAGPFPLQAAEIAENRIAERMYGSTCKLGMEQHGPVRQHGAAIPRPVREARPRGRWASEPKRNVDA